MTNEYIELYFPNLRYTGNVLQDTYERYTSQFM